MFRQCKRSASGLPAMKTLMFSECTDKRMMADGYDMLGECRTLIGLSVVEYYGIGRRLSGGAVFDYLKRGCV